MRGLFTYGGSGVLVCIVLWGALALLPACGAGNRIAAVWADWCPVNQALNTDNRIAAISDANKSLERSILQRERELAKLLCEPRAPVRTAQPRQSQPKEIDRQDWNSRRIGLLEGCWELDSRFVTTNRQTGEQSRYNNWSMCFDGGGNGREEMRADNGNTCSGSVTGSFNASGALVIEEPGNLQCSDGGFVYRLSSQCTLNDNGTASCTVSQPEVGGTTKVEFRRSVREN